MGAIHDDVLLKAHGIGRKELLNKCVRSHCCALQLTGCHVCDRIGAKGDMVFATLSAEESSPYDTLERQVVKLSADLERYHWLNTEIEKDSSPTMRRQTTSLVSRVQMTRRMRSVGTSRRSILGLQDCWLSFRIDLSRLGINAENGLELNWAQTNCHTIARLHDLL